MTKISEVNYFEWEVSEKNVELLVTNFEKKRILFYLRKKISHLTFFLRYIISVKNPKKGFHWDFYLASLTLWTHLASFCGKWNCVKKRLKRIFKCTMIGKSVVIKVSVFNIFDAVLFEQSVECQLLAQIRDIPYVSRVLNMSRGLRG